MNITEIERYIEKYLYKIKNLKLETNNSNNNTSINNQSNNQIAKEDDLDSKKISFKRNDSLIIKVSPQHQQLQSSRTSLTKSNHKSKYLYFFAKLVSFV